MTLYFPTDLPASAFTRGVQAGNLRRLARGLYTDDLATPPERLVREAWVRVTSYYFPGAVISDRSRPEARPDAQGRLYLVHPRTRPVELPGLTLIPRPGHAAFDDDVQLPPNLRLASVARGLVENLAPSRAVKGRPRRTLSELELHQWVARLARTEGADRLNQHRDRARQLAGELGLARPFQRLDEAIGAALGTRELITQSPALGAAQAGLPYDERRDETFAALAEHLVSRAPVLRTVFGADRARLATLPFFEAYFSNFIEGTEFTVEEAADIVFKGQVPSERPADAHDVLGTYALVADEAEMSKRPKAAPELLTLLLARHARVMAARPEQRAGHFKERANRAGGTQFVAPELVQGTLSRGFQHLQPLDDPFARAVFMMFLVAEVHPFADGNGRVARIMMNAELYGAGQHRIIIPPVFRNEYLAGLRALTHNRSPGPLIAVLDFAQRYTAQLDFTNIELAKTQLDATHALLDPAEADARGLKLVLPSKLAVPVTS